MELTNPKPVGRPTKYKEEYCEQILEFASKGELPIEWAATFGVNKSTLHEWRKNYQEFSNAYACAFVICHKWWLGLHRTQCVEYPDADHRPRNNAGVQFMLRAAFGMRETSDDDSTPKERAEVTFATRSDA